MDNLTVKEVLKLLAWTVTIPIWFPPVWLYRKLTTRKASRGPRPWLPLLLVLLIGCTDSPEARVEKTEAEITRALNNAKKVAVELAKAEKTIADEKAKLAELIGKLNGLIAPKPQPNPNPAPSPVPTPTPPGPQPPVPSPLPTPTEPVDGRFGLAVKVFHAVMAVKTDDLKSEASQFAANFRAVADLVEKKKTDSMLGLTKQAYNISVELTKRNKPLTTAHPAWLKPAEELGAAIEEPLNDGRIKSNEDWIEILNEIANGMDAAAKAVK